MGIRRMAGMSDAEIVQDVHRRLCISDDYHDPMCITLTKAAGGPPDQWCTTLCAIEQGQDD
jgi:hypothetical protein